MSGVVQYKEALTKRKISKGKYFQITDPQGRETLWRMKRIGKDLVMCGPPTEKKIILTGKEGYERLFDLADEQVQKEYTFPSIFSSVRAYGSRSTFEIHNYDELEETRYELNRRYCQHPDDKDLAPYFLASRCIHIYSSNMYFNVFMVDSGHVYAYNLYNSGGSAHSFSYAIRPEAVPNPSSYIQMEGRDGSRQKPYILLSSAAIHK